MPELNPLDALLLAIEIEDIGKEFYTKAAARSEEPTLKALLIELASMESEHSDIFRKMFKEKRAQQNQTESSLGLPHTSPQLTGYLKYLFDLDIFKHTLRNMPKTMEEVLTLGIEAEKSAIIFYTEIKNMTEEEETHTVLEKILHQEKIHFMQLSEKLKSLRTPQ